VLRFCRSSSGIYPLAPPKGSKTPEICENFFSPSFRHFASVFYIHHRVLRNLQSAVFISMHCSMQTVVSCAVRDCVCHKLPFCNDDDDNHLSDDSQQAASRKRCLDIPPNQVHDEKRRKHDRPFAAAKSCRRHKQVFKPEYKAKWPCFHSSDLGKQG
jgi:hypothetical protein